MVPAATTLTELSALRAMFLRAPAAAACAAAVLWDSNSTTKRGMAPAAATLTWISPFTVIVRLRRAHVATIRTPAALCAPNSTTKGGVAPAAAISILLASLTARLHRARAAASCTAAVL